MKRVSPGDIVARISYGSDLFFKVREVFKDETGREVAILKGLDVRLLADAPVSDLQIKSADEILRYRHLVITETMVCFRRIEDRRRQERTRGMRGSKGVDNDFFEVPGLVLHLDGDEEYLEKCRDAYKQLGVPADCYLVPEKEQPKRVQGLLNEKKPEILVATGHDALTKGSRDPSKMANYRNSRFFVETVRAARTFEPNRDNLVIFAGACQSHYEALIASGANFASAPLRVLIHAYDPVFVAERVSYTPFQERVFPQDVVLGSLSGREGIGGVDTRGHYRLGFPKSPY